MNLPRGFLLGLIGLAVYLEWMDPLPGLASSRPVWSSLPWLLVPWLLAAIASRWLAQAIVTGSPAPWRLRASAVIQQLVVPAAYLFFVDQIGWVERIERAFPQWSLVTAVLLLAPLFAMDWSVQLAEEQTARRLRYLGLPTPVGFGLARMPVTVLVAVPFVLAAAAHGWSMSTLRLEAFFGYTALGNLIAMVLILAALAIVLPLVYRWVFPVTTRLPARIADTVHDTIRQLGFAQRNVLLLDTKMRAANAAVVGFAPWPRYLVLTDGLVNALDAASLRGVIAHEVGHVRARHSLWLILLLSPVLFLLHPVELLLGDPQEATVTGWVVVGIVIVVGVLVVHRVGHRFEFEADQLSAELLDDPNACADALQRVRMMSGQAEGRASFRHPGDSARLANLARCANDPLYRRGFWQRGARFRRLVVAVFGISVAIGGWAQFVLWPVDAAAASYVALDFDDAKRRMARIDDASVPSVQREFAGELRERLNAALTIADGVEDPEDSDQLRDRLVRDGRSRGRDLVLGRHDVSVARSFLELTMFARVPDPVDSTLLRYLDAVEDTASLETLERIHDHLRRLGASDLLPAALAPQAVVDARED